MEDNISACVSLQLNFGKVLHKITIRKFLPEEKKFFFTFLNTGNIYSKKILTS